MLLLQTGVITKKKDLIDQGDVEKFARFSLEFEKANILTPILSAFEILPTRVRISRISTKKLPVSNVWYCSFAEYIDICLYITMRHRLILFWYLPQLTSKAFVTTNACQEEFLALNSQHNSLCNIDTASTEYVTIVEFLNGVLEDARLRIVRGSPECKSRTKWLNDFDNGQTNLRLRLTTGQLMKALSM